MPFRTAAKERGLFAGVRRRRTYFISDEFCDTVLPRLKDNVLFTWSTASCGLVDRTVRAAFDTWSHNSNLTFVQTPIEASADFVFRAEELGSGLDRVVLGRAFVPRTASEFSRQLPVMVASDSCWYQDRGFCSPVIQNAIALNVVAVALWAPALAALTLVLLRRPAASAFDAVARIVAWALFIGVPLALPPRLSSVLGLLRLGDGAHPRDRAHARPLAQQRRRGGSAVRVQRRAVRRGRRRRGAHHGRHAREPSTLCLHEDDVDALNFLWESESCAPPPACYEHAGGSGLLRLALAFVYSFWLAWSAVFLRHAAMRLRRRAKVESASLGSRIPLQRTNLPKKSL